jgi:hypothetical protein
MMNLRRKNSRNQTRKPNAGALSIAGSGAQHMRRIAGTFRSTLHRPDGPCVRKLVGFTKRANKPLFINGRNIVFASTSSV